MRKKKILMLADFMCATGFAKIAENIAHQLHSTGEYIIDVIGINYYGNPYDRMKNPFNVYPAMEAGNARYGNDPYGRQKFLDILGGGDYDIAFIIQDIQVVNSIAKHVKDTQTAFKNSERAFTSVLYYPVDSYLDEEWVQNASDNFDFTVTYTQFGVDESIKAYKNIEKKIQYIYHGVDTHTFKPIDDKKQIKNDFLKRNDLPEDTYIFTNINRNQRRKDIPATMFAFRIFKDMNPNINVFLYLHMQQDDVGCRLTDIDKRLNLVLGKDWSAPMNFNANKGYQEHVVNEIYNLSDCIISTTLGEGWGLSMTEAMATKTPLIFPDNTALSEIINTENGFLAKSGTDYNLMHVNGPDDHSRIRLKTDVYDLAKKMQFIYENHDKNSVQEKVENAYRFAQTIDWSIIGKQWNDVFKKASETTDMRRSKIKNVGRNEPCPNHPDKKFKKCCGKQA